MSIPSKQRICKGYNKECNTSFVSNSTLCSQCRNTKNNDLKKASQDKSKAKKIAEIKDKLPLSESEIEAMKGSNFKLKNSKRVKSESELQVEKDKRLKQKTEKDRLRRKAKREEITEKRLDTLVSKVIRELYGNKCCTCGKEFTFSTLHNGHFQSRRFRATRFNPENCSSQCPSDNLYFQGLQYEYGLYLNRFHGEGTAEKLIVLSKSDLKIDKVEREAIYKVYQDALVHKDLQRLIKEYYQIFNK